MKKIINQKECIMLSEDRGAKIRGDEKKIISMLLYFLNHKDGTLIQKKKKKNLVFLGHCTGGVTEVSYPETSSAAPVAFAGCFHSRDA